MLSILVMSWKFMSCNFMFCIFLSCIFMSCNFMPWKWVRQFHVLQFWWSSFSCPSFSAPPGTGPQFQPAPTFLTLKFVQYFNIFLRLLGTKSPIDSSFVNPPYGLHSRHSQRLSRESASLFQQGAGFKCCFGLEHCRRFDDAQNFKQQTEVFRLRIINLTWLSWAALWQPSVIGNQCSEYGRLIRAYRRYYR